MIINLDDAGFNMGFTSLYWAYSSGFPKASNIGKMVDKRAGPVGTTEVGNSIYAVLSENSSATIGENEVNIKDFSIHVIALRPADFD